VQVPKLLQPFPIGELLTEGEAAIFGETEDIELLVVDELRYALFHKIPLDAPQLLGREAGADLAEVVAEVHMVGLMCLSRPNQAENTSARRLFLSSTRLRRGD
jgi:hypothetical protein